MFGHKKSHPPFLAPIFYPGVFYFENLNFGALFHLKSEIKLPSLTVSKRFLSILWYVSSWFLVGWTCVVQVVIAVIPEIAFLGVSNKEMSGGADFFG